MEPVSFFASVAPTTNALQFGDAGRVEIWSKATTADVAAALNLLTLKQKRLLLRFYLGTDTQAPVVEFRGAIAQINSSLVFSSERAKAKFDVAETDILNAARLVGYTDRVLRLEVALDGDGAPTSKPEKERGPHGKYWQWLFGQCSIAHNPALLDKLQLSADASTEAVKLALRDRFNVASLTFVSPAQAEGFAARIGITWPKGWQGGGE